MTKPRRPDLFDRLKAGEKLAPEEYSSYALQRRVANELEGGDPVAMERFKREHDGLTPLELALKLFPIRKGKPPPVG